MFLLLFTDSSKEDDSDKEIGNDSDKEKDDQTKGV
jgi:hypothetical protein